MILELIGAVILGRELFIAVLLESIILSLVDFEIMI